MTTFTDSFKHYLQTEDERILQSDFDRNAMMVNINIATDISVQNIRTQNDRKEIFNFILGLDQSVAETDFTLALIMGLAQSLKHDMNKQDFEDLAKEIANITPDN